MFFCFFRVQEQPRPRTSGPFKLDQTYISEIEKGWVRSDQWERGKASKANMDFLHSPLKSAEINGVCYPAERLQQLISKTPTHLASTLYPANHFTPPTQRTTSVLTPSTPK